MDSIKFDFDGKVLYSKGESRSIADIIDHTGDLVCNIYNRNLEVLISTDSNGRNSFVTKTPLGTHLYGDVPIINPKNDSTKKTRYLRSRYRYAHGYPKMKLTMEDRQGGEHIMEARLHYSYFRNKLVISAVYDDRQSVRVDSDGNYTFKSGGIKRKGNLADAPLNFDGNMYLRLNKSVRPPNGFISGL